jgi:hypothetical protein
MAKKDLIKSFVNSFLQQQSDHAWLMIPLNGNDGGCDEFKNTVAFSTFSASLNRNDFGYYIDTTFSDIPENLRTKMKGLLVTNQHSFHSEDVIFDYGGSDSKISASLIQIIAQKNQDNELEMLVGFISLVRKPTKGWRFNQDYWKSDKQKVQRGLQYIFGNEAQKEIAHK